MSVQLIPDPVLDAEERFEGFENLMPFKVHNILLVSSLYDSFILREDGRLNELLIDESLEFARKSAVPRSGSVAQPQPVALGSAGKKSAAA